MPTRKKKRKNYSLESIKRALQRMGRGAIKRWGMRGKMISGQRPKM